MNMQTQLLCHIGLQWKSRLRCYENNQGSVIGEEESFLVMV